MKKFLHVVHAAIALLAVPALTWGCAPMNKAAAEPLTPTQQEAADHARAVVAHLSPFAADTLLATGGTILQESQTYGLRPEAERKLSFIYHICLPDGEALSAAVCGLGANMLQQHADATTCRSAEALKDLIDKRWQALKQEYTDDMAEMDEPLAYSFATTIVPIGHFGGKEGMTTFLLADETYTGGAHGMTNAFCLTLSDESGKLLGLTDIFIADGLPKVFDLVAKRLSERAAGRVDETMWPPVAELAGHDAEAYLAKIGGSEAYQGKWYPRPALTPEGVLFSYQQYEKDCYAAGIVQVLLPYTELEGLLKVSVK